MSHYNRDLSMVHVSDEELVRSTDGELSLQRAAEIEAHLEACWDCRARESDIHSAIAGFVHAYHAEFDEQLPPAAGPRALLRARLAELGSTPRPGWLGDASQFLFNLPRVAVVCLWLITAAIGILWLRHDLPQNRRFVPMLVGAGVTPNRSLTPGATRQITMSEVCSVSHEEVVGNVSIALRQKVLQEYGMVNVRPEDYEIDYLIAPRLGGAEDLRNLWPEPYRAGAWNAHAKDALEERLHEMVCDGQLDLFTAQHDIATDWVATYKKYLSTQSAVQ